MKREFKINKLKSTRPPKDKRIKNSLFSVWRFLSVFAFAGFVVTCSFFLFFSVEGITIAEGTITKRSISGLLNIIFLCICFSTADNIRKKINFEIPVRKILEATHKVTEGDFSTKIAPSKTIFGKTEFDVIIEDFNIMTQELSSIEALKTDFLADVSHELKTPISVIQNYSTLLQDPELSTEKQIEYAENLTEATKNLSELITSILRLNKLENQQIYPKAEQFNLSEQLCQCLINFDKEWEKKSLSIETDFDENLLITADAELLWLVWSNLISNAIKFNRDNGTIYVTLKEENQKAVVKISDTGLGMTPEIVKHIFEKFYQGDTSRTTKGNGLGLALVKRVMDITGGEISVESKQGSETCFTVILPLNNN